MFQIRPLAKLKSFTWQVPAKAYAYVRSRLQHQLAAATPTQKDLGRLELRKWVSLITSWAKKETTEAAVHQEIMADSGSNKDMVPINVRDPFFKDPFFSSTWDDFDQMRNDMMARSKAFWSKVDEDFANFDETVRKMHTDMDRQMQPLQPQLPRWAIPDDLRDKWTPAISQDGNEVIYKLLWLGWEFA